MKVINQTKRIFYILAVMFILGKNSNILNEYILPPNSNIDSSSFDDTCKKDLVKGC